MNLKPGDKTCISGGNREVEVITVLRNKHGPLGWFTAEETDLAYAFLDDYNRLSAERGEPLAELVETFHGNGWNE